MHLRHMRSLQGGEGLKSARGVEYHKAEVDNLQS